MKTSIRLINPQKKTRVFDSNATINIPHPRYSCLVQKDISNTSGLLGSVVPEEHTVDGGRSDRKFPQMAPKKPCIAGCMPTALAICCCPKNF